MEDLVVKSVDAELRKINASKLRLSKNSSFQVEKRDEEDTEDFKSCVKLIVGFKQKSDKSMSDFFVKYSIPSYVDQDIEITAEFAGRVHFEKPFDFEQPSKTDSKDKEVGDVIIPRIMEEVNLILKPIFESMNLEYVAKQ